MSTCTLCAREDLQFGGTFNSRSTPYVIVLDVASAAGGVSHSFSRHQCFSTVRTDTVCYYYYYYYRHSYCVYRCCCLISSLHGHDEGVLRSAQEVVLGAAALAGGRMLRFFFATVQSRDVSSRDFLESGRAPTEA